MVLIEMILCGLQVHPRGNAVFLWDRLLQSQSWVPQHLIRHLYVCPPFHDPPLHHFLLLQSPTLHCASGKPGHILLIRMWYLLYPWKENVFSYFVASSPPQGHHRAELWGFSGSRTLQEGRSLPTRQLIPGPPAEGQSACSVSPWCPH